MGTHGEPCRLRAAGGGGVCSGRASRARALALALVCCLPVVWGAGPRAGRDRARCRAPAGSAGERAAQGGRRPGARDEALRRDGRAWGAEQLGVADTPRMLAVERLPGPSARVTACRAGNTPTQARSTLRLRGGSTWGSTWGSSSFAGSKKAHNPENDPEVALEHCPNDGITALRFSPKALLPKNYLVATTWDGEVRCYEADTASGKTMPVGMQRHEKPAMCCAWKADGSAIYSGGADGKGMMWHLATNSWTQIAQHDGPISSIFYSDTPSPCVITGSWDRTVKFWDVSSPPTGTPIGVLQMPDRVYAMDVVGYVMVVATAERHLLVYDLRNPSQPFRQKHSPLKYQSRSIAIFPDQTGFCVGSVEGRVAIEHIQDADLPKNFAFKCHRQNADTKEPELYGVNSLAFHPVGTFATAGGDGAFNFWDKDAKHRLKAFQRASQAVTAAAFNHDGALYAYAVAYDWSKGVSPFLQLELNHYYNY